MNRISIVFIGAGPVASESLKLLKETFQIEAVVTKGSPNVNTKDYPVIETAKAINSEIFYANNMQEVDEACINNSFKSSLAVLIDYGVIVSEDAIASFPKGIVNSHFSLLPEWRGADPITYSLLSGQKITGVTLMLLTKGMDEGPVLAHGKLSIAEEDTGISLTDKLIKLSDELLAECLPLYVEGKLTPTDQIEFAKINDINTTPSYSSKITKADGEIDWSKPAEVLDREIRAYQPWPRSYTTIGDSLKISVHKASIDNTFDLAPGSIKIDGGKMFIGTKTSPLELLYVQPAGKNRMHVSDFLRGYLNKIIVQKD